MWYDVLHKNIEFSLSRSTIVSYEGEVCTPWIYFMFDIDIFRSFYTPFHIYSHSWHKDGNIYSSWHYTWISRYFSGFLWESITSLPSETYWVVNLKIRDEQCKSPANSFLNGGRVIASVSTLERLLFLMQESRNVSFAFFWMILIIWMNDTILIPKWLQRDCINVGLPIWPFGFYHVWSESHRLLFFFEIFLKMVGKNKY